MLHEILSFISANGFGVFLVVMSAMWFTYWLIKSFIERNKPECPCECCEEDPEDDEDEEVVAMGGEEEDDGHQ